MALTTDQPTVELGDIDLLDRDMFASRVPHEWFAWLPGARAGVPASRARRPGLLGHHQARRRHPPATATGRRSRPTSRAAGSFARGAQPMTASARAESRRAGSCW